MQDENGSEPRRRRARGCLWMGPLGCFSFFVGAGLVSVFVLPMACGRVVVRQAERGFAREYKGKLEIGSAHLGDLFGEQWIDGVVLRDPDGTTVLRGDLRMPSLRTVLHSSKDAPGVVHLQVQELDLRAVGDSTNLARAFEPTEGNGGGESGDRSSTGFTVSGRHEDKVHVSIGDEGFGFRGPVEVLVEGSLDRVEWTDAEGNEALLARDLRLSGRTADEGQGGRLQLSIDGPIELFADPAVRGLLQAQVVVSGTDGSGGGSPGWTAVVAVSGEQGGPAPAALAAAFDDAMGRLAGDLLVRDPETGNWVHRDP